MKTRKPGAVKRWRRRFEKPKSSLRKKVFRVLTASPSVLRQVALGFVIVLVVIGIALWDHSIRRFVEASMIIAPGVGLSFGGYPLFGVPLVVVGVFGYFWFVYKWSRVEMPVTVYPVSWFSEEISETSAREPILF